MMDNHNRKINYLRLSVTDLCNLRCQYCMPECGVLKRGHEEMMSFEEINGLVSDFVELGIEKIRLTGGEPLTKKNIVDLVKQISRHKEIKDLSMTTNGIRLAGMAKDLKEAGLQRVNISLDTLDEKKYESMTRGGQLKQVMDGIEAAIEVGLTPIKINVVLIGGFNDDEIVEFVELTRHKAIDVRFIELMPIGEVSKWSKDRFLSNEAVLKEVPELKPIEKEDKSSPANYYQLKDGRGKVGLISPISCKFCDACNRIRLTADGMVKYCLHSDDELNILDVYRNNGDVKQSVIDYIQRKPKEHKIEEGCYVKRDMVRVGG